MPEAPYRPTLTLACFVMFRNESPILGPFLDQLQTFFDHCALLDHASTDNSAALVQARQDPERLQLYQLKSSGYPQGAVATFFAHKLLKETAADFLFFLDCDEFLPFADRAELERFLIANRERDIGRMCWRNIAPNRLDGGNIFSAGFQHAADSTENLKTFINASLLEKAPDFVVAQGYHKIVCNNYERLSVDEQPLTELLHIPVQSHAQIAFKLTNGFLKLANDPVRQARKEGYHWSQLAQRFSRRSQNDDELRTLGLHYPFMPEDSGEPPQALAFRFPYVHSAYHENASYIAAQTYGLMQADEAPSTLFSITDSNGERIHQGAATTPAAAPREIEPGPAAAPFALDPAILPQQFDALIQPLFDLPAALPEAGRAGHIPLLLVLFKLLRPRSYVELGCGNGNSLIAACSAARKLDLGTQLVGVDQWPNDADNGDFSGDRDYQQLRDYLQRPFPDAELLRCPLLEARQSFRPGSIDLLHINAASGYSATRDTFQNWIETADARGVVLLQHIHSHSGDNGPSRLWPELQQHYQTLEFPHAGGLGVLLLDPGDPRLQALTQLSGDATALRFYQYLTESVAAGVEQRMASFKLDAANQQIEQLTQALAKMQEDRDLRLNAWQQTHEKIEQIYRSPSWRISAPLRGLLRALGKS